VRLPHSALALLLAATAVSTTGCIRFSYSWVSRYEPVPQEQIDGLGGKLAAGEVRLQACLDELGAPVLVWNTPAGFAIAYGWQNQGAWNIHVGYTWQFIFRAHFDYSSASDELQGVVLWFDDRYRLLTVERGRLSDFVQRTQPPAVQD